MHSFRTAFDWLIVFVNAAAVLLGLAIGWLWIAEGAGQYATDNSLPSLRIGMCVGSSWPIWPGTPLSRVT
jgi:hypothetical protein